MSYASAFTLLILLVGLERIIELVVSKRNLDWSNANGGIEFSFGHYPFMVFLHTGLLIGALFEMHVSQPKLISALAWPMFALAIGAQILRWWCVTTLGKRWNTRIVLIPNLPRIVTGPYKYFNHPNYIAVIIEGIALPLVGFSWITALIFTILNIPLLFTRIRAENSALATLPKS